MLNQSDAALINRIISASRDAERKSLKAAKLVSDDKLVTQFRTIAKNQTNISEDFMELLRVEEEPLVMRGTLTNLLHRLIILPLIYFFFNDPKAIIQSVLRDEFLVQEELEILNKTARNPKALYLSSRHLELVKEDQKKLDAFA